MDLVGFFAWLLSLVGVIGLLLGLWGIIYIFFTIRKHFDSIAYKLDGISTKGDSYAYKRWVIMSYLAKVLCTRNKLAEKLKDPHSNLNKLSPVELKALRRCNAYLFSGGFIVCLCVAILHFFFGVSFSDSAPM